MFRNPPRWQPGRGLTGDEAPVGIVLVGVVALLDAGLYEPVATASGLAVISAVVGVVRVGVVTGLYARLNEAVAAGRR